MDCETINLFGEKNIKEHFLEWIFENHKLLRIDFADEQLRGFIEKISKDVLILNVIDNVSYKRNGFSIICKKDLRYFKSEK